MKRKIVWSTLTFLLVLNSFVVYARNTVASVTTLDQFCAAFITAFTLRNLNADISRIIDDNTVITPAFLKV